MRKLFLAALCCAEFSWAQAWDPNRPLIYRMWLAFEHQGWVNMYSTATVLSKSDDTDAFRVVAYSTTTPTYQLLVTTQGYVGISTGNPQAKFHVSGGDSRFGDGSAITISSSGYMTFANLASSPTASAGRVYYDSGSNKLRLSTGSAWADFITSADGSGTVSVGTTTSSAMLTVYSGSGVDALNVSVVTGDGANWTQATSANGLPLKNQHTSVVFNNKMWVISGHNVNNDIWYSSDGATWTEATASPGWVGRHQHASVVFNNKIWVLGGWSNGARNDVWYSSDGVNWTQASSPGWSQRYGHTSVVFNNKIWVIGGGSTESGPWYNDVWYSSDGTSWTQAASSPGWAGRTLHTSVVFNNKIWVIGGANSSYLNDVWYSNVSTGTASPALTVTADGKVGIGTLSPDYTLSVNGEAWVSVAVWSGSDARWKKNVAPISDALDKVLKLRGVSFDWRADEFPALKFSSGGQIGFIAQEVKKVFPEIVSSDAAGYLGISYEKLAPVFAEAIKEQQRQISAQQGEIENLKAENKKLESANERLETRVRALEKNR